MTQKLLILGGTAEAFALAQAVAASGDILPITSMAGRTRAPRLPPGELRLGGFGGAQGLADYLRELRPLAVVDATHPFAARMKSNAIEAAALAEVPLLRLERQPWTQGVGDRWQEVADWPTAMDLLGRKGGRVLAAVGSQDAARLEPLDGVTWLVRSIERPSSLLSGIRWIQGRPPFFLEDERRLLIEERIHSILCKNGGGEGARAKLDAARELHLPVVMVRRPAVPPAPTVATVEEAIDQLRRVAGRSTCE